MASAASTGGGKFSCPEKMQAAMTSATTACCSPQNNSEYSSCRAKFLGFREKKSV
jgi:hypothetical protein